MDVDGVLTDGSVIFGPDLELKCFNITDGLGIVLALRAGLRVAWITGRCSDAVRRRARELGVTVLLEGAANKRLGLTAACRQLGTTPEHALYLGDDLNDLPAFAVAGLPVAVASAAPEVREAACWVTRAPGGRGAVRETIERLLREQGRWQEVLRDYLASLEAMAECRQ